MRNLSLKAKLLTLCTGMVLAIVAVGVIGYRTLNVVAKDYHYIATITLENQKALSRMRFEAGEIARLYLRPLVPGLPKDDLEKNYAQIDKAVDALESSAKVYESIPFYEGEEAVFRKFEEARKVWSESVRDYKRLISSGSVDNYNVAMKQLLTDVAPKRNAFAKELDALIEFNTKVSDQLVQQASSARQTGEWSIIVMMIGFSAGALLIGALISWRLAATLDRIAGELAEGAKHLASSSQQIASTSEQLSSASQEQAAALQQTVSTVQQITSMVEKNANNAEESREVSNRSQSSAEQGRHVIEEMLAAMKKINQSNDDIRHQVEDSNREISDMVKMIKEIGDKTKVIDDIVFQTKLLSFNASVEAARAGEHGKGFAVVAEEVGNLAQMSGNAAKQISSLLDQSVLRAEEIVRSSQAKINKFLDSGRHETETGVQVAERCAESLDEILNGTREVNNRLEEINTASSEQSQGIHEVNKALNQIDQATQQNASATNQVATAAETVSDEAKKLQESVELLHHTVHGNDENSAA